MPCSPPGERCCRFGQSLPSIEPHELNARRGGKPNQITTARFTLLSWLPISLFNQFQRAANVYFLVVSILVLLPESPTQWSSTVLPFVGVLLWTALKDMYEDLRRRRDDDAENNRPCWRYNFTTRHFEEAAWREVLCGDVIMSLQDDIFPADMAIISASNSQAFISTANLDGETNLKERRAMDLCSILPQHTGLEPCPPDRDSTFLLAEEVASLVLQQGLETRFDKPKVGATDVNGSAKFHTVTDEVKRTLTELNIDEPSNLNFEHFVPRGCTLRNTPWLIAVAAYVGDETKARLSVHFTSTKISNMQVHLNRCVKGLVLTLCLFCLYAAVMAQAMGEDDSFVDFILRFRLYWIILYQIVPISLYVCFEIMKLLHGFFINKDAEMKDPDTGQFAFARTADLVEEMGQVEHIFTDKTGTLTQNEMRFARCCVAGHDLGEFRPSSCMGDTAMPSTTVSGGTNETRRILEDESDSLCEATRQFFLCLVSCHSAQVEDDQDGSPRYSGSSPDEVALLEAAHQVGYSLFARRAVVGCAGAAELQIRAPGGAGKVTVLCEVPFSSDRKRMTVVCSYNGRFLCITKGADSVMAPLCTLGFDEAATTERLAEYAKLGLRTLVVAWKALDADFFAQWRLKYDAAKNASSDREDCLATCAMEIEHSLKLAGITAIEDRLQDEVPEAIATLKKMQICVWVLTGDKAETAVEIARACRLLSHETLLLRCLDAESAAHAGKLMRGHLVKLDETADRALVLDGNFLKLIMADANEMDILYELATKIPACVCCRLAPQQKRALVEMVRKRNKYRITLAIGDGANDTAMIQGAHIGIAVRGKEGNQAVQASDVVVSQFRFLVPLLLSHGRRAYRRIAVFLCYYIYKHVVLMMGDFLWAHQDRFAGKIAYPEWLSSGYSLLFTSLPVIVVTAFDVDLPGRVVLAHPDLYEEGQTRLYFNGRIFVGWILSGVWHGGLAWYVPNLVLGSQNPDERRFWVGSFSSFTLVITFVSLQLWMVALNPLALQTAFVLLLTIVVYVCTALVLGETPLGDMMQPQIAGVPIDVFGDGKAMAIILLTPFALCIDAVVYGALVYFFPSKLDRLRWHARWKMSRVSAEKSECVE